MDEKIEYDRITEVLSPFSGIEFVPKNLLDKASMRGTNVHKTIEAHLSGWDISIFEDEVEPYYKSFLEFWESSNHLFKSFELVKEKRLYCDKLMITGQIDLIVVVAEKTYLLDWKTSANFSKSWYLQGAAYKYLCQINGYPDVDDCLFVKLKKDGKKPTLYKSDDHKSHINLFQNCLDIYRYFDMKKTRKAWNE